MRIVTTTTGTAGTCCSASWVATGQTTKETRTTTVLKRTDAGLHGSTTERRSSATGNGCISGSAGVVSAVVIQPRRLLQVLVGTAQATQPTLRVLGVGLSTDLSRKLLEVFR